MFYFYKTASMVQRDPPSIAAAHNDADEPELHNNDGTCSTTVTAEAGVTPTLSEVRASGAPTLGQPPRHATLQNQVTVRPSIVASLCPCVIEAIQDKVYAHLIKDALCHLHTLSMTLQSDDTEGWGGIRNELARHHKLCYYKVAIELEQRRLLPPPAFAREMGGSWQGSGGKRRERGRACSVGGEERRGGERGG